LKFLTQKVCNFSGLKFYNLNERKSKNGSTKWRKRTCSCQYTWVCLIENLNLSELHIMSYNGTVSDIKIKLVMISNEDGETLMKYLERNPTKEILVRLCFPLQYTYFW
jgi:hypothetical protein